MSDSTDEEEKMQSSNEFMKHHPDTIKVIRETFNLHQPGRMEEALAHLQEWIQAQPHFNKKDFSRDYLEAFIINCKGSVEKTKKCLERVCAMKTFERELFSYTKRPVDFDALDCGPIAFLPTLGKDHYRILLHKNFEKVYTPDFIQQYNVRSFFMLEYLFKNTHFFGVEVIVDLTETDFLKLIPTFLKEKSISSINIILKGYQLRVKKIHYVTSSKLVDTFINTVKPIFSKKINDRIFIHKNWESLYTHVDKDLLPLEYGGKEKSLKELTKEWAEVMSTDENMDFIKEIFEATIDPSKKPKAEFNDLFLGMPGTFRTLQVD